MAISGQNHFELFSLPQGFGLDIPLLNEKAQALLGKWHPDRFAGAPDNERRHAVQMTTLINEAVETLQKPLSRAAYLLSLEGVDPSGFSQSDLGTEFLLQQMMQRDQLEDLASAEDLDGLDAMKQGIRAGRDDLYRSFQALLEAGDTGSAKKLFHQLQFIEKLLVEINQCEDRLLDY